MFKVESDVAELLLDVADDLAFGRGGERVARDEKTLKFKIVLVHRFFL